MEPVMLVYVVMSLKRRSMAPHCTSNLRTLLALCPFNFVCFVYLELQSTPRVQPIARCQLRLIDHEQVCK